MNWHAQTRKIAGGDDPLLTGDRNVRLPRLDLIAGVALALVVSLVSGLNGFVGVTPADADAPTSQTRMAERASGDVMEPVFAETGPAPVALDLADADFTVEVSEMKQWTATDRVFGPSIGYDRSMNRLFRSIEPPVAPLTCVTIDGATFN